MQREAALLRQRVSLVPHVGECSTRPGADAPDPRPTTLHRKRATPAPRIRRPDFGGSAGRGPRSLCLVMTTQTTLEPAEMERAFFGKDASYDGLFFTGVRTTGIFCRPSCPARKPLRRNIEFFPSVNRAVFAGYRPCQRCRPLETDGRPPEWVERLLAKVDADPERRIRSADLREPWASPPSGCGATSRGATE